MMVGAPTRYLPMPLYSLEDRNDTDDTGSTEQRWDDGVRQANEIYKTRMHNLCCDNCHSHVACALNTMGLQAYGIQHWNMVKLCFLMFIKGRFVSVSSVVRQFGPFLLLMFLFTLLGLVI
mmetsp:Transcript_16347/g.23338  ORF Transcript_16347/g.23338 Transcript_16347/m.23338 type:complete len:120 (-) Transcript_16347:142-501(-)